MIEPARTLGPGSTPSTREALATLSPWWRVHERYRRRLLLGVVLMMMTALSALGLLAVSGWFITASALTGAALAAGAVAVLDVYTPGSAIRLFAVSRTVSRYLERLYNHDTILRLLASLRGSAFASLVSMDPARLSARRSSDWLNRLTADIDTLDALYLRLAAPPVMALLLILALLGITLVWLPGATLWLALLLLTGWAWLTLGQARWGLVASRRRVTTLETLRSSLMEALRGHAELEAYAALGHVRKQLEAVEARLLADQWRLAVISAVGNALAVLVIGLAWLLLLAMGMLALRDGQLSGPMMVMLPLAAMALGEGLAGLPAAFSQAGATLGAAERLNDIEHAAGVVHGDARLSAGPISVSLEQVSYRYPGALFEAFSNVSLTVEAGEQVAICGASGAGKSTLAALLTGQTSLASRGLQSRRNEQQGGGTEEKRGEEQSGRVLLNGREVRHYAPLAIADGVGCLTQQVDLFDASLADNLRLGAADADDAALWRVLAAVDLADWVASLPQGLATRVGEGGRQVSGGQARRISLARLALTNPGLVLLDEPFSGLDATTAQRVAQGLADWLAGRTVIYLLHEHDLVAPRPGTEAVTRVWWLDR
ncbi:amino acid ABC transporter ATP-binding/permease protein [Cobetia amphilecti]|uniref:ATP-binding cassette domain-containing protein n=1 Tax=Cobetia amphilecti TaxID=1055104 RepID=A0AAP4TVK6_9GAMM|nr:ATP-binding cassette domain-containing protein [Cobetia amphilecti]MDO6670984.1 ATP-binding cassette domain-containing protein [Cobetia amphilecti]